MVVEDEGLSLVSVQGVVPPAAVMCLGRRLAVVIGDTPFCPSRVLLDSGGGVTLKPGKMTRRWLAPELRAVQTADVAAGGQANVHTTAGDLWALGRLLLELSLGSPVADKIADEGTPEKLRSLEDIEGKPLPERLVDVLAVLLAPNPDNRLHSAVAAARVFSEGEDRFGDGEEALMGVLLKARAATNKGTPRTMVLGANSIVDYDRLQKMAREMSGKMSLAGLENERTGDLPAGAILAREDLERIAATLGPSMVLPTQQVNARPTAARQRALGPRSLDEQIEATVPVTMQSLMSESTAPMLEPPILPPGFPAPGSLGSVSPDEQGRPTWSVKAVRTTSSPDEPPKGTSKQQVADGKAAEAAARAAVKDVTDVVDVTDSKPAQGPGADAKATAQATSQNGAAPPEPKRPARTGTLYTAMGFVRRKKVPRALVAFITLALAFGAAVVGIASTNRNIAPAKPLIYER